MWQGCIPFVGTIIEKKDGNDIKLLIQTRWNTKYKSIYNGTFEFVAGVLDKPYESVYEAITREVKEETGLTVKHFIDLNKTEAYSPNKTDLSIGFKPYCCTQQLKDGRPWVGFIFRCEVEHGEPISQPGETKDVHWINAKKLFYVYKNNPDKLFTLEIPAWEYYFKDLGWL